MPRVVFIGLEKGIRGKGKFIDRKPDITGKEQEAAYINVIDILRTLSHSMAFDQIGELCKISKTTTRNVLLSFSYVQLDKFRTLYLSQVSEKRL